MIVAFKAAWYRIQPFIVFRGIMQGYSKSASFLIGLTLLIFFGWGFNLHAFAQSLDLPANILEDHPVLNLSDAEKQYLKNKKKLIT